MKKIFFTCLMLLIVELSYSQGWKIDSAVAHLKRNYPIKKLSKEQMYQDFDSLYNSIKNCDAQLEARKQVTGIDILSELKTLRKEIDTINNTNNFILLVDRALNLLQENHDNIANDIWYFRYSIYKKDTKKITIIRLSSRINKVRVYLYENQ